MANTLDQSRKPGRARTASGAPSFAAARGDSNLHDVAGRAAERFSAPVLHQGARRALEFSATWYLGALTFGTFLILVITGILLMLYYHPSVPQAYADMKDLQFVVSSGVFLRNLHRWSAHAMVFLVFAHMFKVFYRGAYRHAARIQLGHRRGAAAGDTAAELHRLPAAVGPAWRTGRSRWAATSRRRCR